MKTVFTYSEARQKPATVLEQSRIKGEVRIKRKDGREFVIKPVAKSMFLSAHEVD